MLTLFILWKYKNTLISCLSFAGELTCNTLESSWNVDSDRVTGRNFPLKIHEVRDAYFRLLALTKDTRFCKAMM